MSCISRPAARRLAPAALVLALASGSALVTSVPIARGAEPQAAPAPSPTRRVDLNTATEAELIALPKVGPAIAQQILEYRRQVGTIRSVDELLNVKGIGEKTLESLRPHVTVSATAAKAEPKKP